MVCNPFNRLRHRYIIAKLVEFRKKEKMQNNCTCTSSSLAVAMQTVSHVMGLIIEDLGDDTQDERRLSSILSRDTARGQVVMASYHLVEAICLNHQQVSGYTICCKMFNSRDV